MESSQAAPNPNKGALFRTLDLAKRVSASIRVREVLFLLEQHLLSA